jgi:membrane protein required for colicin V production
MAFNWVDYSILSVIGLSTIISVIRGFIREALSLAIWGLASWLSLQFGSDVGHFFVASIPSANARLAIGCLIVFFTTLIIGMIINSLVAVIIRKTGLSSTDRLLGTLFGIIRGILIVAVILLFSGLTAVNQASWWKKSYLIAKFQPLEHWLQIQLEQQTNHYLAKELQQPDKADSPSIDTSELPLNQQLQDQLSTTLPYQPRSNTK